MLLDWHGGNRPVAVSSSGDTYILDDDGQRAVVTDVSAMSVASIGHSDPALAAVIHKQAGTLSYVPRWCVSDPQLLLAERIAGLAPGNLTRSWIGPGGGATGMEAAVKLAIWYHTVRGDAGRHALITFRGAYHGNTVLLAAAGGYEAHRRLAEPYLAPGAALHAGPLPAEGGSAAAVAADVEALIVQAGAQSVAALIAEPVSGSLTGAVTGPDGWLPAVRDVCRRYGVLFIADETMTGFGRTGDWFAVARDSPPAVPDILVAGKLMTSGVIPLTAVTATDEIFRVLRQAPDPWPVRFTHAGDPVGCAAALEVIDRIERDGLLKNAAVQGRFLRGRLEELADDVHCLGRPRGLGLQLGIPVRRPRGAGRADAAALLKDIKEAGQTRHRIMVTGGTGWDGTEVSILVTPPLDITEARCEDLAARLAATVDEVTASRYGTGWL